MKKGVTVILILSLMLISLNNYIPKLVFASTSEDEKFIPWKNGYPEEGIKVIPEGLAPKTQKINVTVTGRDYPNPKTVWTEGDRGQWVAVTQNNERVETVTAIGKDGNKYPQDTAVKDRINMYNYAPESLQDTKKHAFKREHVKQLGLTNLKYKDTRSFTPKGEPSFTKGQLEAVLNTTTGHTHEVSIYRQYETGHQGQPKYQAHYFVDLIADFEGYITETKELRVSSDATMKIGETKNLKVEIRTQEYSMSGSDFTKWLDITRRTEQLEWSSDRSSVATVGPDGKVTAVGKGTAKITAKWKSYPYYIYDSVTITVGDVPGKPDPTDPPDPSGSCTVPEPGTKIPNKVMDPKARAVIKADNRGNEQFDVLLGIPTSEYLYANAFAHNYLFKNSFVQMTGKCTFEVPVEKTFIKKWKETGTDDEGKPTQEDMEEEETVSDVVTVERPYSFWVIDNLEVYKIQEAKLQNTALPNGGVTLEPQNYTPPDYSFQQQGGIVKEPEAQSVTLPSQTVGKDIPDYSGEFKAAAEKVIGKVRVQNDSLVFQGKTIMSGQAVDENGSSPGTIPSPATIGENTLYKNRLLIDRNKVNAKDLPSSGAIHYELLPENISAGGGENTRYPIYGINTVTIHTPVVMYPKITDDQPHNQRVVPDISRAALILDRPFTVTLPTSGQHTNYPGYGNRDYAKYTARKQVLFEFDVWDKTKSKYILKNTWIDVPVNQLQETFIMPVWIDEGNYTVHFRAISENAPTDFTYQTAANTQWQHHVAVNSINVNVIGRLYDFRITDISDFDWETVFRTSKGSKEHSKNVYWIGDKDIDGNTVGNRDMQGNKVSNAIPLQLPIKPGSHPNPGYKNVTVKTGYPFKFDFKTIGNMFGANDKVRIVPSFYFVNKDGSGRIPVDLYYHDHSRNKYFIKIGSSDDIVRQYVKLDDPMRNVPAVEIIDSANYAYSHYGSNGLSKDAFVKDYLKKAKQNTLSGSNSLLMLPYQLRTFIGPKSIPSTVNPQRANASIQKWHGEYYLPPAVYVVKAGTNIAEYGRKNGGLHDKSPIFLKDGYIIVNFNIETIRNNDTSNPYLRYYRLPGENTPLDNQWSMEGFKNQQKDKYGNTFNLLDGDVLFYHANLSSYDDFNSSVPH